MKNRSFSTPHLTQRIPLATQRWRAQKEVLHELDKILINDAFYDEPLSFEAIVNGDNVRGDNTYVNKLQTDVYNPSQPNAKQHQALNDLLLNTVGKNPNSTMRLGYPNGMNITNVIANSKKTDQEKKLELWDKLSPIENLDERNYTFDHYKKFLNPLREGVTAGKNRNGQSYSDVYFNIPRANNDPQRLRTTFQHELTHNAGFQGMQDFPTSPLLTMGGTTRSQNVLNTYLEHAKQKYPGIFKENHTIDNFFPEIRRITGNTNISGTNPDEINAYSMQRLFENWNKPKYYNPNEANLDDDHRMEGARKILRRSMKDTRGNLMRQGLGRWEYQSILDALNQKIEHLKKPSLPEQQQNIEKPATQNLLTPLFNVLSPTQITAVESIQKRKKQQQQTQSNILPQSYQQQSQQLTPGQQAYLKQNPTFQYQDVSQVPTLSPTGQGNQLFNNQFQQQGNNQLNQQQQQGDQQQQPPGYARGGRVTSTNPILKLMRSPK